MVSKIFVNLPVKDLEKTKEFFGKLGFTFNAQFTDDKAACMEMGENIFAMLLEEEFFRTFIKTEIADATKTKEVLNALALESREKVDDILAKGLAAGGTEPRPAQDHGWMYGRSLEDFDGHIWEFFYMDESRASEAHDPK